MTVRSLSEARRSNDPYYEDRVDLACAFRWAARLDMHEAAANHFSLAVSDDGKKFLVNPNARHFARVKASDLLLLDADDPETMNRPDAPDPTAWAIHGAMHRNVPQARCLMHVHSKYATVLATLQEATLPPIDQASARFFNRVAVDEGFDGMGLDEEGERLSTTLGGKKVLVMGNHGVMVAAETVAEAFDLLYYFERSCQTVITAYMTGKPLRVLSDAVAEKTAQQWESYPESADSHLRELKAILDEEGSNYRE